MASTGTAYGAAAIERALQARYGYPIRSAARPPRPPPPPPADPPPRRTPDVAPPIGELPGFRNLARAPAWVRAHQRLAFGIIPCSLQEFNALGGNAVARYDAMVDRQLAWEGIDDSAVEARLAAAGYTTLGKSLPQLWADHVASGPAYEVRMRPSNEVQRATLLRAVFSKRQLRERLATFWNDHFNVTVSDYDAGPLYPHYNRDVIRAHAFGNFRAMLEDMARSTSMMFYLDNRSNRRAGPNENFARELLELHTMGAEHYLGFRSPGEVPPAPEDPTYPAGYTDIDVYETAAAFTGWSIDTEATGGTFLYRPNDHDIGLKLVLGMLILPEQPALKDGRDVLDRLASHPKVAKFICGKLVRHFVADEPPQSLVDSAAAVFRQNWQHDQQIRLTLAHILHAPAAREAWGGKRRRPSELLVAALRAVGGDWSPRVDDARSNDLMWQLGFTGHVPHDWAAPNGYPDVAGAWSGSNSFAMTWRLLGWLTEAGDDAQRLLPIVEISRTEVAQWTARNLVEFWSRRVLGYLPARGRMQMLLEFMAQNGHTDSFVIADSNEWKGGDLKAHYNHDRLRNMVSMLLMSPELFQR